MAGFRRILELKGSDGRASLAIADIYVALRRFDDAAAALEKASQNSESAPFFANKLGEVRVEQGRDGEAVPLFERAIALDDGFALPHFNLGVLHEKRGRFVPPSSSTRARSSSNPASSERRPTLAGSTPRWAT